jgi:hypothetical protein
MRAKSGHSKLKTPPAIETLWGIAETLNQRGIPAPRGGNWLPVQVPRAGPSHNPTEAPECPVEGPDCFRYLHRRWFDLPCIRDAFSTRRQHAQHRGVKPRRDTRWHAWSVNKILDVALVRMWLGIEHDGEAHS